MKKFYQLPDLPYAYSDLEPFISEKLLKLHYQNHHQAYVNGANNQLKKLDLARKNKQEINYKAALKNLSYHVGGHVLHSLFWQNMAPVEKSKSVPKRIQDLLDQEFSSLDRFKSEFSQAAKSVEGSGWAVLTYCQKTRRPVIAQIEKHNQNLYPGFAILLVLDVWEHAYYLDYQNRRSEFVDSFWEVVDWQKVAKRLP